MILVDFNLIRKKPFVFVAILIVVFSIASIVVYNFLHKKKVQASSTTKGQVQGIATTPIPTPTLESTVIPTSTPSPIKTITAVGNHNDYGGNVTVSIKFPQAGGGISGSISGNCNGDIVGTFDGKDGGKIIGGASGTCKINNNDTPANADIYNSSVDLVGKSVHIYFKGKAGSYSHDHDMMLYF